VWSALAVNRKIKDQTRLSHQKRFNNLEGAYSINDSINYSANPGNGSESNLVVIDDLVTSGASLREAVRVLRADKRFAAGIGRNSRQISAVSACVATHHLPNTITP
jgi:predicted amidophosphoribosyltransferase